MREPNPQDIQRAITALEQAHTGIHQSLAELKRGSTMDAKTLISQQIAKLANALMIL